MTDSLKERLIKLHHSASVSWQTLYKIAQKDSSLQAIFTYSPEKIMKEYHLNRHTAASIFTDLHDERLHSIIQQYLYENMKIITIFDENYPKLLKNIYDPPWVLYAKGNLSLLNEQKLISVVGTRTPTHIGIKSLEKLVKPLVENRWVIISGLAKGIDGYAHRLALENEGHTIAVLGSGLYHIYPACHQELAKEIAEQHLLLTEFPPYQKPQKWTFPLRNRIISGLTLGTLIIEAKQKSGTLITADQAIQQGREVFAIPGSILELNSVGTNKLIQQGAKLVMTSEDIIDELPTIPLNIIS